MTDKKNKKKRQLGREPLAALLLVLVCGICLCLVCRTFRNGALFGQSKIWTECEYGQTELDRYSRNIYYQFREEDSWPARENANLGYIAKAGDGTVLAEFLPQPPDASIDTETLPVYTLESYTDDTVIEIYLLQPLCYPESGRDHSPQLAGRYALDHYGSCVAAVLLVIAGIAFVRWWLRHYRSGINLMFASVGAVVVELLLLRLVPGRLFAMFIWNLWLGSNLWLAELVSVIYSGVRYGLMAYCVLRGVLNWLAAVQPPEYISKRHGLRTSWIEGEDGPRLRIYDPIFDESFDLPEDYGEFFEALDGDTDPEIVAERLGLPEDGCFGLVDYLEEEDLLEDNRRVLVGFGTILVELWRPDLTKMPKGLPHIWTVCLFAGAPLIFAAGCFVMWRYGLSDQWDLFHRTGLIIVLTILINMFVHEISHMMVALDGGEVVTALGAGLLHFFPMAYTELPETERSPQKVRQMVYLAGVLSNLALGGIGMFLAVFVDGYYIIAAVLPFTLVVGNMIPIQGVDGGLSLMDLLRLRGASAENADEGWLSAGGTAEGAARVIVLRLSSLLLICYYAYVILFVLEEVLDLL